MALFNLRDLRAALARNQRLIGLDPGSRTHRRGTVRRRPVAGLALWHDQARQAARQRGRDRCHRAEGGCRRTGGGAAVVDGWLGRARRAVGERLGAWRCRKPAGCRQRCGTSGCHRRRSTGSWSARLTSAGASAPRRWTGWRRPGRCRRHSTPAGEPVPRCRHPRERGNPVAVVGPRLRVDDTMYVRWPVCLWAKPGGMRGNLHPVCAHSVM